MSAGQPAFRPSLVFLIGLGAPQFMRTVTRKPRLPEHHRPRPGRLTALRHDLAFAAGVVADVVRNRPFANEN